MSFDRLDQETSNAVRVGDDSPLAQLPREELDSLAAVFKALGHDGRLMILCQLAGGEKTVTELEVLLGQRQAAVSQQLARLRLEGLVATRREGKAIYYSIQDPKVLRTISLVYDMFCKAGE